MVLTTLLLATTLLANQQPQPESQKSWVIEIRGYSYHAKPMPKDLQIDESNRSKIDIIEPVYVDNLRSFFESLKKEKP